jgi:MFS family permease
MTAATTDPTALGPAEREALQRRSLRVLMLSQVLGGAGLGAGVTVGALLAEDMLGSTALSGLPAALFTLGSAGAAMLVGSISERRGRRPGLTLGYLAGAVGGAGIVLAAVLDSPALLLLSLLVYGSGTATNLQARYAGGDLAAPQRRGTAVSTILVATTIGAVAGPNLVATTGELASGGGSGAGRPVRAGAVAYAAAALFLTCSCAPTRCSPRERSPRRRPASGCRPRRRCRRLDGRALGGWPWSVTQLAMVAVMTGTPIHMRDHGPRPRRHGAGHQPCTSRRCSCPRR